MNVALTRYVSFYFVAIAYFPLIAHLIIGYLNIHVLDIINRAKYFLFVIARRRSIMVNHYWRKLVSFAREKKSLIQVPTDHRGGKGKTPIFPVLAELAPVLKSSDEYPSDSDYSA